MDILNALVAFPNLAIMRGIARSKGARYGRITNTCRVLAMTTLRPPHYRKTSATHPEHGQ